MWADAPDDSLKYNEVLSEQVVIEINALYQDIKCFFQSMLLETKIKNVIPIVLC